MIFIGQYSYPTQTMDRPQSGGPIEILESHTLLINCHTYSQSYVSML